jgi:hypothetical protein
LKGVHVDDYTVDGKRRSKKYEESDRSSPGLADQIKTSRVKMKTNSQKNIIHLNPFHMRFNDETHNLDSPSPVRFVPGSVCMNNVLSWRRQVWIENSGY